MWQATIAHFYETRRASRGGARVCHSGYRPVPPSWFCARDLSKAAIILGNLLSSSQIIPRVISMFAFPCRRSVSQLIRVIGATALSVGLAAGTALALATNNMAPETESFGCAEAEGCFRAALAEQKNGTRPALNGVEGQSRFDLQLNRLHVLMEKHPSSVWAKRAGLVTGVLLRERDPGRAIQFLRSARRDFPLLEDYLRLWMGQALLKLGDIAEAAALMESILEVTPDSPLATRAAYEAAQAWYRAGQ